ncbi:MAG: hypothetical protein WCC04_07110 [Terriglobales bacterium]
MRHKKNVTDAVRTANRSNSHSSTGPRTDDGKSRSSQNALKHGILARNVVLDSHEQRAAFRALRHLCRKNLRPKGLFERFLVEEVTNIFWKLGIIEPLVVRELLRRQELSDGVDKIFDRFGEGIELPIERDDLPLDRGWDCQRMVVRAVGGADQHDSNAMCGPTALKGGQLVQEFKSSQNSNRQKVEHLEIEAVMGNSLENLTRYQTKLKNDLYRAMETIRKLQAERRESED